MYGVIGFESGAFSAKSVITVSTEDALGNMF
jgi:hypothetical protein